MLKSLYPVICTHSVAASAAFYSRLLGLEAVFEADWFVQLQAPGASTAEMAFVQADHPSVPEGFRANPKGVIITLESDAVDEIHARATSLDLPIALSLRDEEWGQRHFMTVDPDGLLVDIVKIIPASAAFQASYTQGQPGLSG